MLIAISALPLAGLMVEGGWSRKEKTLHVPSHHTQPGQFDHRRKTSPSVFFIREL
jgi:hypothetical protein